MGITLSVIIPAYNESRRLPPYLESVRQYLDRHYPGGYEIIVVDAGSRDGLSDVLARLAADWPQLQTIEHPENRGKGAAVRTGMLAAAGGRLLFADADGATPIDEEAKLSEAVAIGADLAVGSRLVAAADVTRRRTRTRGLVGLLFAGFARWWLGISVRDTQCGFKMFRREAGRELFSLGEESGYLFDLELLVLAERLGYRVAEVPVNWADVPGGHLKLTRQFGKILLGLWQLRWRLSRRADLPPRGSQSRDRRSRPECS
ncbi:MAG: dolichyl-phosphate beta-glucosyltransferase [Planctomycetota bacterium]|jgi:dolichyl-phosphate beta-glucosyltransferase